MKVYLYPEHSLDVEGKDPREDLQNDPGRFSIALFDGRIKDGNIEGVHIYNVIPDSLEMFLRLAAKHGCSEVYW